MNEKNDISCVLLSEEEIKKEVKRLGREITEDYKDKDLLLVSVLKGAFVFMSDLLREIKCDCTVDFMAVSSYSGTKTTGVVAFKKDLDSDPTGKDILIVEDVLDSGITLSYLKNYLLGKGAKSIKICTMFDKPTNRKCNISADYIGKVIPDEFIVGYGLDYNEAYRNLPYLGVLSPKAYE